MLTFQSARQALMKTLTFGKNGEKLSIFVKEQYTRQRMF